MPPTDKMTFYFCEELNTYILPVGKGIIDKDDLDNKVDSYTRLTGVPDDKISSGEIQMPASLPDKNTAIIFIYSPGQGILINPNATVSKFDTMQSTIEAVAKAFS